MQILHLYFMVVVDNNLDQAVVITMPATKLEDRQNIKLPNRQVRIVNGLRKQDTRCSSHSLKALLQSISMAKAIQIARRIVSELQKAFQNQTRIHCFTIGLCHLSDFEIFNIDWNSSRKIYGY